MLLVFALRWGLLFPWLIWMLVCLYFFILYFSPHLFLLDQPIEGVSIIDFGSIRRARDILADSIMSEIINEDPQSQAAFKDSLHHQIVITCQRLRVYLHLVDRLMALFNQVFVLSAKTTI